MPGRGRGRTLLRPSPTVSGATQWATPNATVRCTRSSRSRRPTTRSRVGDRTCSRRSGPAATISKRWPTTPNARCWKPSSLPAAARCPPRKTCTPRSTSRDQSSGVRIQSGTRTDTGSMSDQTPVKTYREAISDALWEEMERDERIFIMGEEVGVWGGTYAVTRGFYDHFGEKRVRDTPIAEQVIVGAAVGAAMNGLRPVAEIMTINFAFLALDAIVNHAAKAHYMFGGQFRIPLVIRTTTGGGRQLGATHSHSPEHLFAHFPGLKVAVPGTPYDAKGMLKTAMREDNPVLFVEHSTLYQTRGEVPADDYTVPIGQAAIRREGTDVTLVSLAKMMQVSLQAADLLAQEGISAEVIDLRSLSPLDTSLVIESFRKRRSTGWMRRSNGSRPRTCRCPIRGNWSRAHSPIRRRWSRRLRRSCELVW